MAMGVDPNLIGNDAKGAVGRVLPVMLGEGLDVGIGAGAVPIGC